MIVDQEYITSKTSKIYLHAEHVVELFVGMCIWKLGLNSSRNLVAN